jgi:hypothetical protein
MADIKFSIEKENYRPKPGESLGTILTKNYDGKNLIWGPDIGISDPSQPPIKDEE